MSSFMFFRMSRTNIVPHQRVNGRVNNMGRIARYSCLEGFILHEALFMSCFLFLGCPAPVSPVNGRVNNMERVARYSCLEGFILHGSSMSFCRGKTWIRSPPACISELL